jgi:hypothetical protein
MLRTLSKLGLLIISVGAAVVGFAPKIAVLLADLGEALTAIALGLACQ